MKFIGRMDHLAKTRNLAETKVEDSDSLNLEDTLETFWKILKDTCRRIGWFKNGEG